MADPLTPNNQISEDYSIAPKDKFGRSQDNQIVLLATQYMTGARGGYLFGHHSPENETWAPSRYAAMYPIKVTAEVRARVPAGSPVATIHATACCYLPRRFKGFNDYFELDYLEGQDVEVLLGDAQTFQVDLDSPLATVESVLKNNSGPIINAILRSIDTLKNPTSQPLSDFKDYMHRVLRDRQTLSRRLPAFRAAISDVRNVLTLGLLAEKPLPQFWGTETSISVPASLGPDAAQSKYEKFDFDFCDDVGSGHLFAEVDLTRHIPTGRFKVDISLALLGDWLCVDSEDDYFEIEDLPVVEQELLEDYISLGWEVVDGIIEHGYADFADLESAVKATICEAVTQRLFRAVESWAEFNGGEGVFGRTAWYHGCNGYNFDTFIHSAKRDFHKQFSKWLGELKL